MKDMHEMRQRVGPVHERVVRLSLAVIRGLDWGKSKIIVGMYDMFAFVAASLGATTSQRFAAAQKLYKILVREFEKWDYNPKKLPLGQIDWEKVL
jgi:hypothetical protein